MGIPILILLAGGAIFGALKTPAPLETLVGLQIFVVAFLLLHDWIPLGRLNDVKAVQAADSRARLMIVTLLSALPYTVCLWGTLRDAPHFPGWLVWTLWIAYGALTLGAIRAWWWPYFITPDPKRAVRYEAMFGSTLAFLPARNGIRPNALHVALHLAILAILIVMVRSVPLPF